MFELNYYVITYDELLWHTQLRISLYVCTRICTNFSLKTIFNIWLIAKLQVNPFVTLLKNGNHKHWVKFNSYIQNACYVLTIGMITKDHCAVHYLTCA